MSQATTELDQLSREERRRRAQRLREHRREAGNAAAPAAIPRQGGGPYPLSFAQQRLWFLDQLEPGLIAYNISHALRLSGRLDLSALARSLEEISARHESLRTTFVRAAGEPVQRVAPPAPADLPILDLTGLPETVREQVALSLSAEQIRRPFDLERGPLLRTILLRLGAEGWIVLFALHHIVADGWSLGLFIRELVQLYGAFAGGRRPALPELPIQFGDFARWQRQHLGGDVLSEQTGYWRRRLGGALPVLRLPTDHPHPTVRTYRGAHRGLAFSAALAERLREVGRGGGATLFMTLLGAFAALLHRYSDQDDVLVGSPVTHRNRVETEGLIGFFVNTVVLRIDLAGDPRFLDLLERVRETALGAYSHQDLPFERVVEEVQPDRDLSRAPLFQVLMTLENTPTAMALELPGLVVAPVPAEIGSARIDLGLELQEGPAGLQGILEYSTELFEAPTLGRFVEHLGRLLHDIADHPGRRISALSLLGAGERHQLLFDWNDTRRRWADGAGLHQLFARQAERTPDSPAALSDEESLTYRELARRAGALAHRLAQAGVVRESRVAVCVERAPSALAALLGVLAAGGAYVPLDPESPPERLAAILGDAGADVVVTQHRLAARLASLPSRLLLVDGENEDTILEIGSPAPAVLVEPANAAYVVYTSGSTGTPKGVVATHGGVANFVQGISEALALGPRDRLLLFAPLAFDASVLQIFPALSCGAAVVVHRNPRELSAQDILDLCARYEITVLDLPAALWRQWVEEVADARLPLPPSLRAYLTGGESVPAARLRTWASFAGPSAAFLSSYGPTEATVTATVWQSTGNTATRLEAAQVPIGRPLPNARAYVVDRRLHPVPAGVAGELLLGGPGLARGYLGRPDWTSEVFVPDPLSGEPGGRLYRTGDLARRLPGGDLEFFGRADGQVKIRGFRVEPGEIEAALTRHPAVRQAAVTVREDRPGDLRLAAYVVGDVSQPTLPGDDLRRWLSERLPEPMVPASVTVLDRMPVLPSGKVDRRSLPPPDAALVAPAEEGSEPRTPVEQLVAAIWEEALSVAQVGRHDHFFALGGHSLLATQVVSRVRTTLGADLPLRAIFEEPTLAGLARRIDALQQEGLRDRVPPLRPAPRDRPLPLSFAQQRLWFLHQLDPQSSAYNMPFAFRLSGPLHVPALAASLAEVVRRHETLRTTLVLDGETPVQRIAPPAPQPLTIVDLAGLTEADREALALRFGEEEAARPFDLASFPVVRTLLLRLAGDDHVLLFSIHHVSGDGWSAELLIRELVELYEAAIDRRPARLPTLPVQYADYAVWQRSWLQGDVLAAQIDYWRQQLSGAPPVLEMPLDRPRPPVQSTRGGRRHLRLPVATAEALAALGRREGATGFMTFLAAFQVLLHCYGGQESVVVGTPIANRDRAEVEGLIGFFANTLALRAHFAADQDFAGLLAQVRETSLGAYAHQDLPFEKLVDELAPQRDMSYGAIFQALFVYQSAPRQMPRFRELSPLPFGIDGAVARFDLTLAATETGTGMALNLDYNADLFDALTADRMLRLFAGLLAQVVAEPRRPIADLALLDEAEHRQVVLFCNATDQERSEGDLGLHLLFARQAARTPDAPAVVAADGVVTYGELAAWVGRIAGRLGQLGIGAEDRVGLCLERSPAALAALLGTMTAGAAYVPLDPEWPRERLVAVAADAGLAVLLTRPGLPSAEGLAPCALMVEDVRHGLPKEPSRTPLSSPETAAYVVYTSGSTGMAKGVVISHRAAANFVLAMADTLGLTAADRLLLFAPLSFDASVLQIFPALSRGAAVVVHADPRELAGAELPGFCERHGVTVLDLPAALWRQWIEDMDAAGQTLPEGIRTYLTGGESVPAQRVRAWARMTSRPATFLSSYGPTEATVTATVFLTDRDAAADLPAGKISIGRPLPNVRTYVLDARMHPVPTGVAGELYLAGHGLARGYLGRPAQTAASFMPDALSGARGGRLYRTGDLARRLPDGDLEFLGRADTQVKIRGFRLELAEVETVLSRHPLLAECVVTVREDRPGDRRLVAYAVSQPGAAPRVSELRSFVADQLPQYMVPAVFVLLDALPVLASGKVDRAALPAPEGERPKLGASYQEAATPVEVALAALWAQVLRVDRVGIHDNFFELGGDSILSIQILARANQMGMRLTARQIFEHPTVAELAQVAASAPLAAAEQGVVTGPVPLTPIQRWFFAQDFAAAHHFNQAMVLDAAASLTPPLLEHAVATLAGHHDALRLRFIPEGDAWRQENGDLERTVPLIWIDLSALPAGRRAAALAAGQDDVQTSFDLERGPLSRIAVLDGRAEGRRLLWAAHHLVVDGVSWRVLIEDLETCCRELAEGRAPALPPKTTSFRAWAERLVYHARTGGFDGELPYWLGLAEGTAARLPVDFVAEWQANTVASGQTVGVALTPEETQTLLQAVPSTYRTQINDALLAAVARAFASWTGSPSLLVDLEAHGREPLFDDVDLSRTVGWFTTHFPVRLDLAETDDAVAALLAVKEQLRRVPGHGIGHALLVYEGGPAAASLRAAPPPQVSFNYLGQFDQMAAAATLFRPTGEPAGATRAPHSHRTHLIEIGGLVAGGQLHLGIGYSANLHRRETIEQLGAALGAALRDLIARSRQGETVELAAADFPLVHLDDTSFRKLSALLDDDED